MDAHRSCAMLALALLPLGCNRCAAAPPDSSSSPTMSQAPSSGPPADPPEAQQARARLVRHIQSQPPWGDARWDERVIAAMGKVPRHVFIPDTGMATAYRDAPYPIGHQQTISQPSVVALMTNALQLTGRETVLEIGTGSGYQAAVLAELAETLYSIELIAPLGEVARARLAVLGYRNVHVRIGDGYQGWPEHAPFDRIILTAAPPELPQALVEQLREGGLIVAPVGTLNQELLRWRKQGGDLVEQRLGAVRFVPMVPGSATPAPTRGH